MAPPPMPFENVWFDLAPDGNTLVFSSAKGELCHYSFSSRVRKCLFKPKGLAYRPKFSYDGKHLVFCLLRSHEEVDSYIAVCAADGSSVRVLTSGKEIADTQPSFSPDNSRVVFARFEGERPYTFGGSKWDHADLYTVKTNGSNLTKIPREKHFALGSPLYLQNGTLLYSDILGKGLSPQSGTIYRIPGGSTTSTAWYSPKGIKAVWVTEMALSHDEKTLAFIGNTDPDPDWSIRYDINLVDMATRTLKPLRLVRSLGVYRCPVFAPNGTDLYYLHSLEDAYFRYGLWRINLTTRKTEEVLKPSFFE